METNKFEQLKNIARKTSLTAHEKTVLRSNIESFMKYHPVIATGARTARVKSPFSPFMIFARSVAFVLIGMLAGGSGLAYASEQALPGDVLYPVKINVTEEVVSVLSFTPEAKLEWETKRILRRVDEIQKIEEVKNTQPISADDTKLALESLDKSLDRFNQKAEELKGTEYAINVLEATRSIEIKLKDQGSTENKDGIPDAIGTTDMQPTPTDSTLTASSKEVFAKGTSMTQAIKAEYGRIEDQKLNRIDSVETENNISVKIHRGLQKLNEELSNKQ